jgi:hypothetical protein
MGKMGLFKVMALKKVDRFYRAMAWPEFFYGFAIG